MLTEHQDIARVTPKDLWDILKRQKRQFEETHTPVMLAGPFLEGGVIRCVVKYVPDVHRRIPDELHRGMIEAVEIPNGRGTRVVFRLDTFPDPELFERTVNELLRELGASTIPAEDSGHYAYPPEKRKEIVQHFRTARLKGEIQNKDKWAWGHYNIGGKTLLAYEREFPEMET